MPASAAAQPTALNVLDQERVQNITAEEACEYLDAALLLLRSGKINPMQDEGIVIIVCRGQYDCKFFAQVFLSDWFDDPMTHQHEESWRLLDDQCCPKVCECAWRGYGKSAQLKAKIIHDILYRLTKYVMWVGKTHDCSAQETENIKMELVFNEKIRLVFGNIKARKYEEIETSFSKKSWFACDPVTSEPFVFVTPKGAGQPVRGMNVRLAGRIVRVTFMVIDDLEDDKEVKNGDLRKELRKWFNGALLPCVNTRKQPNPHTRRWTRPEDPQWSPPWRVYYADTFKHEDSNMAHIMGSSDWKTVIHPECEYREDPASGKYRFFSLVPEILSDDQIREEVRQAKEKGTMDVFAMEKMCCAIAPEGAAWTKKLFHYYSEDNYRLNKAGIERFIVVDPAQTTNPTSAHTGILAVGLDLVHNQIFFRREISERLEVEQQMDKAFNMAVETNSRVICVEITGMPGYGKHAWENARAARGLWQIEFMWIDDRTTPQGDFGTGREARKRARAATINPYYKAGQVFHEISMKDGALELLELSYDKCPRWDIIDCAGLVLWVMEKANKFFSPRILTEQEAKEIQSFGDDDQFSKFGELITSGKWRLN